MHSTWYNINCRLDDYAASIQLKGCPLGNCVAFVDGSHVPGIMTDKSILGIHYFGISGGKFGNIYKTSSCFQLVGLPEARGLGIVVTTNVTVLKCRIVREAIIINHKV